MSDTPAAPEPQPPAASDLQPIVVVGYFLFLIACMDEITAQIGVVVAHSRLCQGNLPGVIRADQSPLVPRLAIFQSVASHLMFRKYFWICSPGFK